MNADLGYNYAEALKRQKFSQSEVDVLRESAKIKDIIPKTLTNKQLLLFLNANDGNIDKSVNMMVKHYEIKKKAPQLFTGRDVKLPEIKQCIDNQYYINIPPTSDNYSICLHGLSSPVAKNYNYDPATTTFLMMIDAVLYKYGPTNGLILLYDMRNFNAGHLMRNNLKSLKKFMTFIQEAMPIKIHEIHIFNTVPFFNLVMNLIKPFMRSELVKMMNLHPADFDFEPFYREHLSKSHLPSDYGGDLESIEKLHEHHKRDLLEMREYFLLEMKQVAMELEL